MITCSYTCKNCGAPIAFSEGEESVKCDYCGAVNELTNELAKDVQERAAKITIAEVSIKDQADALLRRAYLFLEDGDVCRADEYFDKVLDLSPEEYRAYLGKLMLELSVTQEDEISSCDVDLTQSGNYEKLLCFAPKKKRAVYENYNRTIQSRLEEQARQEREAERQEELERQKLIAENKREEAIDRARMKKKANAIIIIIALFSGITMTIHKVRQHNAYENGLAYLKSGDNVKAVEAFEATGYGYKDVKERIRKPAYEQAERLFKEGGYLKAASYYIKADGYQDSTQKLRAISRSISPIFKISEKTIAIIKNDGTISIPYCDNPSDPAIKELKSLQDVVSLDTLYNGDRIEELAVLKRDGILLHGLYYEDSDEKSLGLLPNVAKFWLSSDKMLVLKTNGDVIGELYSSTPHTEWSNIADIKLGYYRSALGLKKDGTVVFDGDNFHGEGNISSWRNIKAIAFGERHSVGLKNDGTVVAVGSNDFGQCEVSSWKNIIEIIAGNDYTLGIKSDGTVVAIGDNDSGACDVSAWQNVIAVDGSSVETFGLKSDGTVLYAGDDQQVRNQISTWKNIVYIQPSVGGIDAIQSDGTFLSTDPSLENLKNKKLSDIAIAPIS